MQGHGVCIVSGYGMTARLRDKRQKRDLHALDEDGMVLCNPRDKEAAHRADVESIATADYDAATCRKCIDLLHSEKPRNKNI